MARAEDPYRLPTWQAIVVSLAIAVFIGFMGSMAGTYLYDRDMSRGNDLAVSLIGLHVIGTFVFVLVLSWLRHLHNKISWRTPAFALLFCLGVAATTTLLFWKDDDLDAHYMSFMSIGWILILLCGLAAMVVSRYRFVSRFDKSR
jgi:hypothetical protein